MSRRQQQATLVEELHARVQLTPLKEEDATHSYDVSPMRNGVLVSHDGASSDHDNDAEQLNTSASAQLFSDHSPRVDAQVSSLTSPPLKSNPVLDSSPVKSTALTGGRRVIIASPAPRTSSTLLTSASLAAQQHHLQQHQEHVVVATVSASGSIPRAGSHDSDFRLRSVLEEENTRLKHAVHTSTQRVMELEALVRELSATVHKQATDLEAERTLVRGLKESLVVERASSAAARNTFGASRVPSPNRGTTRTGSPVIGTSRSGSAAGSAPGPGAPAAARTSSPSIARPTASSARRSPSLPEHRTISPGGINDRPRSAGRTMSPIATRQQLATATFMRGTTASALRTGSTTTAGERSSSHIGGAARPRLGGQGRAVVDEPIVRSTTVVMQNGVVVPPASSSSTTRRITPARERVEAAIARMLPQQHRPQLATSASASLRR
jgi:hypothetical protein